MSRYSIDSLNNDSEYLKHYEEYRYGITDEKEVILFEQCFLLDRYADDALSVLAKKTTLNYQF
jgi:hypothetical protein